MQRLHHLTQTSAKKQQASTTTGVRQRGTAEAHKRIVTALRAWVENHPAPEEPAISIAGEGTFSPMTVLAAVEKQEGRGPFFEDLIVHGAKLYPDGLEGVLRSFREEALASRAAGMLEAESSI